MEGTSSEELSAQELLRKANLFQQFYVINFGGRLALVRANANYFFRNPANNVIRDESFNMIDSLEKVYQKFPEKLPPEPEFAPLVVTRAIMPEFTSTTRSFFSNPNSGLLAQLEADGITIGRLGYLFRDSFSKTIGELRKQKGFEKYTFNLRSLSGYVFENLTDI
jgi:hypothetical protein